MMWLTEYHAKAARTDQLLDRNDHCELLIAGMLGEAGSIASEAKKMTREGTAYPAYRQRLIEELGDFLWYFVRFVDGCGVEVRDVWRADTTDTGQTRSLVELSLDLGGAVTRLPRWPVPNPEHVSEQLCMIWDQLVALALRSSVDLAKVAERNLAKIQSRWPAEQVYHALFDETFPTEEQIPRVLTVDFLERGDVGQEAVLLRCNGIGIGDRITDNIAGADGYRYHDIFHIAYAVFLGWSPVIRSLLRCKRKSNPTVDQNEDGARAAIVEEAVSAIVFSRAKEMAFFHAMDQIDYDLLKSVQEVVVGFEVQQVPLWQWERAILEGYRVFRLLRSQPGGRVTWDIRKRIITHAPV